MASPTIKVFFQPPTDLANYDRTLPATSQHPGIPHPFLDCMAVRESVFVHGQNIPIELEADSDDCRCHHWVAYASSDDGSAPVPVGTVRIVPYPQEEHPEPGGHYDLPENITKNRLEPEPRPWIVDRPTSLHNGREPYLKLGRMAVVAEYRKYGVARKLVDAALDWAAANGKHVFSQPGAKNDAGEVLDDEMTVWNGLVCAHAQCSVEGFWAKMGFTVDEKMGMWHEAGIPHVGMFKRLKVAA